ncbi:hypothetical protein IF2G_08625 [Cordyceps javanica]|nr:hypothetical protein IF2G_08625 [Cordyceps javanica]
MGTNFVPSSLPFLLLFPSFPPAKLPISFPFSPCRIVEATGAHPTLQKVSPDPRYLHGRPGRCGSDFLLIFPISLFSLVSPFSYFCRSAPCFSHYLWNVVSIQLAWASHHEDCYACP